MNGEDYFLGFLTITSPLASKRQCKANSELVPPPGNALEQHKFRRCSTEGNKKPLHQRAQHHGKTPRCESQRSLWETQAFPAHVLIPLCCRSWFSNSGQGFQTRVALCVSWATAETSWSSGISAWNLIPMLMRL